jgi:hypothetical protein
MGGAQQQQQQAPAAVVYATAQPTGPGWGGAQAQTPVMATAVPQQQPQPQVIYVQAPPMMVGGRPYVMGGACACGGSGTLVTRQVSGTQILSFVLLLLFFWPVCWLPFCMDQCCECAARATPPRPRLTPALARAMPRHRYQGDPLRSLRRDPLAAGRALLSGARARPGRVGLLESACPCLPAATGRCAVSATFARRDTAPHLYAIQSKRGAAPAQGTSFWLLRSTCSTPGRST